MKARNRPPHLEVHAGVQTPAAPPTRQELLVRAKVAGPTSTPGRTELRHLVEHLEVSPPEAWDAVRAVYGTTEEHPSIDPDKTLAATAAAAHRIASVARDGGRIAFATAAPASWLAVHLAIARLAQDAGADVADDDDRGPLRVDGRHPRWLRWVDGVAAVTDGRSLLATIGPDAATEWLFLLGRPALVVADGPFADAAAAAGVDTVTFAGLDRPRLAPAAVRAAGVTLVPVHGGRPGRAYRPVVAAFAEAFRTDSGPSARAM